MRVPLRSTVLGVAAGLSLLSLASCGDDDAATDTTTAAVGLDESSDVVTTLGPDEAAALIESNGVTIVDVRTPEEYAAGHLEGAVNIDVESADFDARLAELDPSGAYVVYCRSGNRSAQASARMAEAGFTEIYDAGGIEAWQAAGYPVVTD